ncbi:hypothetical protein PHMEG_0003606 [Phytophthora megakarya]|uniref:Myb-like domain-containing protein n=1 Tax=Phytophthora megakarya TaxID=4795 RepID=A0A225WVX4_9STRA|nr:hypothetical protein PHMEG_0003606 [Phytophthora megakarya]
MRRNFSDEEDLALLRQALGDRPFLQPRGGILAKWDALAATLVADESFPRDKLSGKTASGRFDKLLKAHREQAIEAAALSGVSEDESEKTTILDEIVTLIDDHAASVAAAKESDRRKREREEEASLTARRLAMETLREGSEEGSPPKKRKDTELKELLISLKEKEAAEKRAEREEMALQRAQERMEDRAEAARARQEANEHMLQLVGAVTNSILAIINAQKAT